MKSDWIRMLSAKCKAKATILALSLGLAGGFAAGHALYSSAEGSHAAPTKQDKDAASVPIHDGRTDSGTHDKDDQGFSSSWCHSSSSLMPPSMVEFWRSAMMRDHDADWMFRNFDDFSADSVHGWPFSSGLEGYALRLDTASRGDKLTIKAEVPGIEEKDLDVSVTDNTVTIKGEKRAEVRDSEKGSSDKSIRIAERSFGSFERTVVLPCKVDRERAEATLKNGILTITLPKTQIAQSESKKLTVKTE